VYTSDKECNFGEEMTKKPAFLAILAVALILSGATLLISCFSPYGWGGGYRYSSNGERIYFTTESSSSESITYSGGIRMMHPIACVNCHGPEGKGGRVAMMMWQFDVPDITWDNLTREEHHEKEPGQEEHEEHPPYTEETLKRAITRGIDPAGEPLDEEMPRWRMSERDLNDLVDFIMTLE